jgi:hypothetical protein
MLRIFIAKKMSADVQMLGGELANLVGVFSSCRRLGAEAPDGPSDREEGELAPPGASLSAGDSTILG